MAEAYPLSWPQGWPRTPAHKRLWGQFKVSPDKACRELGWEIERIGGQYPTISTNVPVRRDGMPYADLIRKRIEDPGVAVYFERRGKQMCFACDTYDAPWKNIRAISKTIEAIRAIERYGATDMMERSLSAFEALPAPDHWRAVLGVSGPASREVIERQYRMLAKQHHPDHGGNADEFQRISDARERALQDCK